MTDYEFGDELSEFVVRELLKNDLMAHAYKANSSHSRYVNQSSGDVCIFLDEDDIFLECKRNGAISRSSIENFRGHEYVISEAGVLNDPERIHVIPRLVVHKYIETIVKSKGWSKLPRSKADGIILIDKYIKGIKAGRTLKKYIEELK